MEINIRWPPAGTTNKTITSSHLTTDKSFAKLIIYECRGIHAWHRVQKTVDTIRTKKTDSSGENTVS